MRFTSLTSRDSQFIKGVGILFIMIHNFMHLFPKPKENEFAFNRLYFDQFINGMLTQPENFLQLFFSYFGHFGVQVFIFLSAYGLGKKYANSSPNLKPFLFDRVIKTYPAFILAIIFWALIVGWRDLGLFGPAKVVYWHWDSLLLKLTLLSNFVPGEEFMPVGPWWFLPFIFQFYLFFPILIKIYHRFGAKGLLTVSIVSMVIIQVTSGQVLGVNLFINLFGHLPELCLGLYLANVKEGELRFGALAIIVTLTVFIIGNLTQWLWFFNHITILILFLAIFLSLQTLVLADTSFNKLILIFGHYSLPLFLVNGFLREPMVTIAIVKDNPLITIMLCGVFLALSVMVAVFLSKAEEYCRQLISKKAS